ncbi:MAG: nucleotidyltransferase domain-containing protein [Chloroflexi bacterium]|nr:nucleotidyltransferase domain-containing protein [Chloroflexota bacterium]
MTLRDQLPITLPLDQIEAFCQKWDITEMALFGSVLRDDFSFDSDIDFLITVADDRRYSLYHWVQMEAELQAIVEREIDLVDKKAVERSENYIRRRHILNSARVIYARG